MGLYIQKDEQRSELQERIAAELREKAARAQDISGERPDGIEDSAYIRGTKKTTTLAGAWVLIVVLIVAVVAMIIWRAAA